MEEIWKDVKGYEGYYLVSNLGNVKSVDRYVKHDEENVSLKRGAYKKAQLFECGYMYINLSKNGKSNYFRVHRLVAEAFIPNPDNLPEVNHKDENKLNNCVDNLEWCTREYNLNYGTGRERNKLKLINNLKLSKAVLQYTKDEVFIKEYPSAAEVERETGINHSNVALCCMGKRKTAGGYIWKFK